VIAWGRIGEPASLEYTLVVGQRVPLVFGQWLGFKLGRRSVTETRIELLLVIYFVQEVADLLAGARLIAILGPMHLFPLQRLLAALGLSVPVRATPARHADPGLRPLRHRHAGRRGILHPLIRMVAETGGRLSLD
jgi:hypothetical protein